MVRGLRDLSLPIVHGRLQWNPEAQRSPTTITAEQLVPTKAAQPQLGARGCVFTTKILSLNAQSLSGKSRFYEEQLDEMQINIAIFQETKGHAGLCRSASFFHGCVCRPQLRCRERHSLGVSTGCNIEGVLSGPKN